MSEASKIVSPEWFLSDDTDHNSTDDLDERFWENLQDEDFDGDLVIAETQKVDFCYSPRHFATPVSDHEVEEKRKHHIPPKTQEDTNYCLRIWEQWCKYRESKTSSTIPKLERITKEELDYWLSRFVLEIRKKDGSEFPPNSIYHICSGIMRHLRFSGIQLLTFSEMQH